ncbi:MAG: hypothetical protein LBL35_04720 [Clostridiales bacterium]|jgi:hypothetical protein|nr:hypothetical protein [Clostridiales bacterium]
MADLMGADKREATAQRSTVATYDYTDENGALLFQKLRYEPKSFAIRRPDGQGGWEYNRKGVKLVPFNLQAVLASEYIFLVEGEKDVETLRKIEIAATCSPDGAGNGKFKPELISYFTKKSIYIIPDNDEIGKAFALDEARLLAPVAKVVKVLDPLLLCPELPEHGDITDVLQRLGAEQTKTALRELCRITAAYTSNREPENKTQEFPELISFEQSEPLPSFPLEALPPAAREFIHAAAETVQAPVDMVGAVVLGMLEIACRGRYPVRLQTDT